MSFKAQVFSLTALPIQPFIPSISFLLVTTKYPLYAAVKGVQEVKLEILLPYVLPFSDPGSDLLGLFKSFDQVLLLQSELTVLSIQ